ncbi:MAG: coagulation factor 5/8 type-like protein [Streptosporangiales bacterium]|nr:coagulation factor 5/8 type-like protein [Streptosporangiales bacterium]
MITVAYRLVTGGSLTPCFGVNSGATWTCRGDQRVLRRNATRAVLAASCAAIVAVSVTAYAQAVQPPPPAADGDDYVDTRDQGKRQSPTKEQLRALEELAADATSRPRLTWNDDLGTPRTIRPARGTLTGPRDGTPRQIAERWLGEHRSALGLAADDLDDLQVTGVHRLRSGSRVVDLRQTFDGVAAVHGGSLTVTVRKNGAVESYAGQNARSATLRGGWNLSADSALEQVAGSLAPKADFSADERGEKAGFTTFARGPFAAGSYARKTVFVTADGAKPAWQVLFVKKLDRAWDVTIDATDGKVLRRASLVHNDSEGTVYPNYPGAPKGGDAVVKSFGPTKESPSGYVDPSGVAGLPGPTTLGNNANSYANWSNYLVPADQGPRPVSATSQFNYAYAANWERSECESVPPSYAKDIDPAATNLFYHHNRIHDEFYDLGFTEEDGNFQVNNDGKGGEGGDPILGLAQAGALTGGEPLYTGRDNAYMLTLPDGIPAWSGMFLWEPINDSFEGPCRDGDFDSSVIEHEYAHGLSNRYVSAEDNALNSHQSGSMGEGWGDWYALNYLHREGLQDDSVVGAYATGNAERGIRNWAYDDNPTTYADIGYDLGGAEVHSDGEIWTSILWDYRKLLVKKYGEQAAARIAGLTVTEAMPRSPADPSFLEMRDSIGSAIDDLYHDSDRYEGIWDAFWTAFAKRGAGAHAQTEGGDDLNPTPAFDHPDESKNGELVGKVVNASTGEPIAGANVFLGSFEAGSTPLRLTGADGGFSAPAVAGEYPVTVQARGFGARTFDAVKVQAGDRKRVTLEVAPNLASTGNGAKVVSASSEGAKALFDDTASSRWSTKPRGNAVVELAKPADVSSVRLSAFTTSRFEALKDFTVQVSTDGEQWRNALVKKDGFGYQKPRPVAPDVDYRTFQLAEPTRAKYVRFYADAPMGETKEQVQAAEVQVFAKGVQGVQPLPPEPPDDPVKDSGTIAAGNPGGEFGASVTMLDLQNNCTAPPASQGTDGWVTKLPDSFGDGMHSVTVKGESAATYDLDLYFYDKNCEQIGSAASAAADEAGSLPSGTKYVLTSLWLGAEVSIDVRAVDNG